MRLVHVVLCIGVLASSAAARAQCADGSPRCGPWSNVLDGAEYYPADDFEREIFAPPSYSFRFVPAGASTEVWAGSVSFFVETSGTYVVEASSGEIPLSLWVYEQQFEPTTPQQGLVAVATGSPVAAGEFRESLSLRLTAGVVYYAVVGATDDDDFGLYAVEVTGAGTVRLNSCHLEPDEITPSPHVFDSELRDVDLQGFCVATRWRNARGESGRGALVGYRSSESVLFSFFDGGNWELNLKLLDGCSLNDHYWLYLSASTDVEYGVQVYQTFRVDRTYENALGVLSPARADVEAIPCQ